MRYRIHIAGWPRKDPASNDETVLHCYYECAAPRLSVAVHGCQIKFHKTVKTKPFRHSRGIYPHLHGVTKLGK